MASVTCDVQFGPPILPGYEWRLAVVYEREPPPFPADAELVAHVRRRISDAAPLAVLTTENGGIVRVSDTEVDVVIAGATSTGWAAGHVHLDMVRSDAEPPEHFGFVVEVPVRIPVTRGL